MMFIDFVARTNTWAWPLRVFTQSGPPPEGGVQGTRMNPHAVGPLFLYLFATLLCFCILGR